MTEQPNPYQPPSSPTIVTTKVARFETSFITKTIGLGCVVGILLAIVACLFLSGGNAELWFYPEWGIMGAVAGLAGGAISSLILSCFRRRPTQ